jgi:hypothetical protein
VRIQKARAACRARSKAEFIAKLGIVLEEADESVFWLELIEETGLVGPEKLQALVKEAEDSLLFLSPRFAQRRALLLRDAAETGFTSAFWGFLLHSDFSLLHSI